MALYANFDSLCTESVQFRQVLDQAIPRVDDSQLQSLLKQAAGEFDKHLADLKAEFPNVRAKFDGTIARVQQHAAQTEQQMAELKAKIVAAQAAKAEAQKAKPPQAVKIPPIDPQLAPKLREELLRRYAERTNPPHERAAADPREAWQDWDYGQWQSDN